MELKTLTYGVRDKIATITLNRPHRMNAWTGRMHTEYRYVLDPVSYTHLRAHETREDRGLRRVG